jgi:hypothetical protein
LAEKLGTEQRRVCDVDCGVVWHLGRVREDRPRASSAGLELLKLVCEILPANPDPNDAFLGRR